MKALKPRNVDIDPGIVEELLHEEYELEKKRYKRIIPSRETSLQC